MILNFHLIFLDQDIDNLELRTEFQETGDLGEKRANRNDENFESFIRKGFKDLRPNIKKKFEP